MPRWTAEESLAVFRASAQHGRLRSQYIVHSIVAAVTVALMKSWGLDPAHNVVDLACGHLLAAIPLRRFCRQGKVVAVDVCVASLAYSDRIIAEFNQTLGTTISRRAQAAPSDRIICLPLDLLAGTTTDVANRIRQLASEQRFHFGLCLLTLHCLPTIGDTFKMLRMARQLVDVLVIDVALNVDGMEVVAGLHRVDNNFDPSLPDLWTRFVRMAPDFLWDRCRQQAEDWARATGWRITQHFDLHKDNFLHVPGLDETEVLLARVPTPMVIWEDSLIAQGEAAFRAQLGHEPTMAEWAGYLGSTAVAMRDRYLHFTTGRIRMDLAQVSVLVKLERV